MAVNWRGWLDKWDRQQQTYQSGREHRFDVMLQTMEAAVGTEDLKILDLASGPGSIALRVRRRHPGAMVVAVDIDPVMIAIAEGAFADDDLVTPVLADVTRDDWVSRLPFARYDAVLTANSLHWLTESAVSRLYQDLSRLLRRGGIFCNADKFPLKGAEVLDKVGETIAESLWHRALKEERAVRREEWWQQVEAEPALAGKYRVRAAMFGPDGHPEETALTEDWHIGEFRKVGFAEAAVIWRHYWQGVLAAIR
jgi:SAM-dependent methyltransferase